MPPSLVAGGSTVIVWFILRTVDDWSCQYKIMTANTKAIARTA
jgi:hypothetical protein